MSRRWVNILLGAVSLLWGCLLYVCFRETTYIAMFFGKVAAVADLQHAMQSYSNNFILYYFPDFLWGFSLGSFLQAIYLPGKWGSVCCGAAVFLLGTLWEILQCVEIISGTGDLLDVLMYLSAGICAAIINFKERKV